MDIKSAAAVEVPEYLQRLETAFKGTHVEDLNPVCLWLGIPSPSDCPTPGQARQWKRNEWGDWANKNNFSFDNESAHTWTWKHNVVNTILISVAKTPGDWRTPMAVATQFRRRVRNIALAANAVLRGAVDMKHRKEMQTCSEDEFRARLVEQVKNYNHSDQSPEAQLIRMSVNEVTIKGVRTTDQSKSVSDIRNLLNLCAEHGQPGKDVLLDLLGPTDGERYWEIFKISAPETPIASAFFDDLKDRLELLKETRRAEKDQKRLEREAKEAEIERAAAEKVRPRTPQELAQIQVDVVHNANVKTIDGVIQAAEAAMRATGSVLDRARLARQNLAKATITGIEDTGALKADLAATRQENDLLRQSQAESLAKVEALLLQVDELKTNQVNPDTIKKLEEDKTHLKAVASMVVDAVVAARTANPFQLVEILNGLSIDAQEALKNHG